MGTINIGIDIGKEVCVATVKGDTRQVLMQTKFRRTSKEIKAFAQMVMSQYPGHQYRAVIESTANYWIRVYDALEREMGIDTVVAHPAKTKAIAEARLKDDKVDSEVLADLLRADLVCQSYVPDREHGELRQLTRARLDMVYERTELREKVIAILDKYELEGLEHSVFSSKGREWLARMMGSFSWVDQMQLKSLLDIMDKVDEQVSLFTRKIASIAKVDENVRLLMTMPGINFLTALTIMAEIADIRRFSTPWKLVSYAGLSPSHRDSSGKVKKGHITKQGSRWLRFAVVEAANTAKVHDGRLKQFFDRIASRRGPQKAMVATGKEILVIIWHMLQNKEPYRGMDRRMVEAKYKNMEWESR